MKEEREREICFFFLKRIVQIGGKLSMFYECSLFHWPRIEMASWDQFECACYYHCPMRAIKIESKQSFYFFSIRFLHASIAVWIGKEWNDCRFCGLPRICAERYWRCMPGNMKCRTNIFFFLHFSRSDGTSMDGDEVQWKCNGTNTYFTDSWCISTSSLHIFSARFMLKSMGLCRLVVNSSGNRVVVFMLECSYIQMQHFLAVRLRSLPLCLRQSW